MQGTEIIASKIFASDPVEAIVGGPGKFNRLFIFTGIADVSFPGDSDNHLISDKATEPHFINLSKKHGNRQFRQGQTRSAPVASLASAKGSDDAEDFCWAVDEVVSLIEASPGDFGDLFVTFKLAVQGENCVLFRIAYQVNVLTVSICPKDLFIDPNPVPAGNNVQFAVVLDGPASKGGETVTLNYSNPLLLQNPPFTLVVPEDRFDSGGSAPIPTVRFTKAQAQEKKLDVIAAIGGCQVTKTLTIIGR